MYTEGAEELLVEYAATQKIYLPCIRDEQIRRGASLGGGARAQVWKGEIELGNTWATVAVKEYFTPHCPINEAKALLLSSNVRRIPKLLGIQIVNDKYPMLFMESIEGVTFEEYILRQRELDQHHQLGVSLRLFEQVNSNDQPPMKCSPNY